MNISPVGRILWNLVIEDKCPECLKIRFKEFLFTFSMLFFFYTGNRELSNDMCKEYEIMYSSCETTRNTPGIEESTDGMILGPEDLNYQIYDVSGKFYGFIGKMRMQIASLFFFLLSLLASISLLFEKLC